MGNVPQHLEEQAQGLITLLKGAAPIQKTRPNSKGWGSQGYSVTAGYSQLKNTGGHQSSAKWKNIWNWDSLPKINFFNWTLAHGKILTGENLMKRGFLGPFNYPLCNNNQEDINHLLWDCPFAKSCWNLAYGDLARFIRWPSSPHPSLGNWDKYYRGSFKDKLVLK